MSRSGYSDVYGTGNELYLYRQAVENAIRGQRGQLFLEAMAKSLDAMPVKELTQGLFEDPEGRVCALGAVGKYCGIRTDDLPDEYDGDGDGYDAEVVGGRFGIPYSLAAEIMFENDEAGIVNETPAERWKRLRRWVDANLEPQGQEGGQGVGQGMTERCSPG